MLIVLVTTTTKKEKEKLTLLAFKIDLNFKNKKFKR